MRNPVGSGPSGENMAKMGVADIAQHLGAHHAMAGVEFLAYAFGRQRLETGPAATGIEFGVGCEQRRATADAAVYAGRGGISVSAAEGALGAFLPRDRILPGVVGCAIRRRFCEFFHDQLGVPPCELVRA